jgi:hypothetical protein
MSATSVAHDRFWGCRLAQKRQRRPACTFGNGLGYSPVSLHSQVPEQISIRIFNVKVEIQNVGANKTSRMAQIYTDKVERGPIDYGTLTQSLGQVPLPPSSSSCMIQTRKPNKSNAVDPLGTMFLSRYLVPSSVPVPCITHCFSPSPSPHHNHIHADLVSPRLLTFIVPMSDTYIHPVCRKKVTGVPCAPVLPWRWRCGGEEPNNDFPLLRNASNASGVGEISI